MRYRIIMCLFSFLSLAHAEYNPEVKTKGNVQTNSLVVFSDNTGRFIQATNINPAALVTTNTTTDLYTSNSAQQASIDGLFSSNSAQQASIDGLFSSNSAQQASIDGLFSSNSAQQASLEGVAYQNRTNKFTEANHFSAGVKMGTVGCVVDKASVAQGYETTANGLYSHAEGDYTTASGNYAHAEGYNTKAYGNDSHAEGYITEARGDHSHTEGRNTKAFGSGSHAEGYYTTASNNYSHADGEQAVAKHNVSYVWNGSPTTYASLADYSFSVNADGGIYFNRFLVASNGFLYAQSNATEGAMVVNYQTLINQLARYAEVGYVDMATNNSDIARLSKANNFETRPQVFGTDVMLVGDVLPQITLWYQDSTNYTYLSATGACFYITGISNGTPYVVTNKLYGP